MVSPLTLHTPPPGIRGHLQQAPPRLPRAPKTVAVQAAKRVDGLTAASRAGWCAGAAPPFPRGMYTWGAVCARGLSQGMDICPASASRRQGARCRGTPGSELALRPGHSLCTTRPCAAHPGPLTPPPGSRRPPPPPPPERRAPVPLPAAARGRAPGTRLRTPCPETPVTPQAADARAASAPVPHRRPGSPSTATPSAPAPASGRRRQPPQHVRLHSHPAASPAAWPLFSHQGHALTRPAVIPPRPWRAGAGP